MPAQRYYGIDCLDEAFGIAVDDEGTAVAVERSKLPEGIEEGTVLRVPHDASGAPLWPSATIDHVETERRRSLALEMPSEPEANDGDEAVDR